MAIEFTQHLMPFGRRVPQWIERPTEVEDLARHLTAAGYTFHSELLRDYRTVSLTVEAPDGTGDVVAETCHNGPEVEAAVDRLVYRAGHIAGLQP